MSLNDFIGETARIEKKEKIKERNACSPFRWRENAFHHWTRAAHNFMNKLSGFVGVQHNRSTWMISFFVCVAAERYFHVQKCRTWTIIKMHCVSSAITHRARSANSERKVSRSPLAKQTAQRHVTSKFSVGRRINAIKTKLKHVLTLLHFSS